MQTTSHLAHQENIQSIVIIYSVMAAIINIIYLTYM